MTHELKIWPEYYFAVSTGHKPFEIRKNDRDFQRGDILLLREWDPYTERYTSRECKMRVGYIMQGGQFGLEQGYVAMAIFSA